MGCKRVQSKYEGLAPSFIFLIKLRISVIRAGKFLDCNSYLWPKIWEYGGLEPKIWRPKKEVSLFSPTFLEVSLGISRDRF
jgi:hypothetical protein